MKLTINRNRIKMAGKAGQIRSCLRKMAAHPLTVKQYICQRHKQNPFLVRIK
ncbi:MAG: Z-ring formation inhibitor MciZ [Thermoactinomyces sp.]